MAARERAKKTDNPDALVWHINQVPHFFCGHCLESRHVSKDRGISAAYRHAQSHLWTVHSLRRVWIQEERPELAQAARLALPLILGANTTRYDRG